MTLRPASPARNRVARWSVPAVLLLAFSGSYGATPSKPPLAAAPGAANAAHLAADGMLPPGVRLRNPYHGDAAIAKAGAALFTSMNCDGCHGGDGSGWVGPSLADGRWRYGGSDAAIFNSVFYGRPKGMPAFGGVLGARGVWVLVTYLNSLPAPADVPTESW